MVFHDTWLFEGTIRENIAFGAARATDEQVLAAARAASVDYIVSAINAVTTTLREIHDTVDEADPSSSGILEDYTQRLEQQSWFLSAQNYSA